MLYATGTFLDVNNVTVDIHGSVSFDGGDLFDEGY